MKKITHVPAIVAALLITACNVDETEKLAVEKTVKTSVKENLIAVNYDNYNQAETARNFNNWAKLGGNNTMLHLDKLSPTGKNAPTIRMNLDTLYSIGVYDNDGEITITIPESGVYQSVMILDTDGYTPFFLTAPGVYPIKHDSETLFVAVRTVVKDRHSEASFKAAIAAQAGIKVEGNGPDQYIMPAYDQEQLHKLTAEYNEKILTAGIAYTYGDGMTAVNEEHRTWSNAAGWGGMAPDVGVSNYYTTSNNLPGDVCYAVTFPETGNQFFTSFTIYDTGGYLMAGNSHINSYTWKSNDDGSTTIHFNCDGKDNNITSNGNEFNYIVRSYGASQKIIDEEINPIKPMPVKGDELAVKKTSVIVTRENYPTVETSRQFAIQIKNSGGINKLNHFDGLAKLDHQPIIRLNQDTVYTMGVVDVSKGATITVPDAGDRFISTTFLDADHYVHAAKYGGGTYDFPQDTDYIYVLVRIGSETGSAEEDAIIAKLQEQIIISANSAKDFIPIEYDKASFAATHKLLLAEFNTGKHDPKTMFNVRGVVNEAARQVGSAIGWAGGQMVDNIWSMYTDSSNFSCQSTTFENPKNEGGFWSITVYNKDGFLFAENNVNSYRAKLNEDGTYTVRFGCEGQDNNIDTKTGNDTGTWNAILRAYRPSRLVQSGKWQPLKTVK